MEIVTRAALAAGLPEGRVMDASASDNLTIPRPRVEVAFLPDSFTRTGRKLAVTRRKATYTQTIKKELYEVRFDMTAHVLAEDGAWLEAFETAFVAAFPRGVNDESGNWVQIRIAEATFKTDPTKRVGAQAIKVFTKVDTLFLITLTGRITQAQEQKMIELIKIAAPKLARGGRHEQENSGTDGSGEGSPGTDGSGEGSPGTGGGGEGSPGTSRR